jgi:phage/plasmid-associated DNA primase
MSLSDFSPEHLSKLRSSALSDQQIDALGWTSRSNGSLVIPYLKPDGSPEQTHSGRPFRRWRLSKQQIHALEQQGIAKPGKYRSPKGDGCRVYHSHLAIGRGDYKKRLADRYVPLRITEGELKVESATVHDPKRLTLGIGGVNSWRDRYDGREESKPLVDWEEIPLDDREVRLCFDSDLDKPQVAAALKELATYLMEQGARVLIEVLPHGLDGQRLGVDDLIHRHGPALFHRIAAIARSPFKERRVASKIRMVVHRDWAFSPEPIDTRCRNVYLSGMIGPYWRRSADAKDRWQQWNGRHWVEVIGDDELTAALETFAEVQGWQNRELGTFRSLQAGFRRSIAPSSERGTAGLIPFRNGALELVGMRLVPHRPEHGNTWMLPYDYNPAAACPRIEAFLLDRLGDGDSVSMLRAFAHSLLTGEQHKIFLEITGPSNTGKSVLANLLEALVGVRNLAAGTLHLLESREQRFETLKLRGKRLAVYSECQDYSGQLQTLKAITGGDPIAAEVKGGQHLHFTFSGGVVLVGNGPIRASDPTGAVVNRRRSLRITKVVPAAAERELLNPDGQGGWRGELAGELPGFVNWCLSMPARQARRALARDVQSIARVEAELETLLETDYLAQWAEQLLIWDPTVNQEAARSGIDRRLSVGLAISEAEHHLYASYLKFMDEQSRRSSPWALPKFKSKLVDLLRDTLALPLPPGSHTHGEYRDRVRGSVVPCLRWRTAADDQEEAPGVIRHAFLVRIQPTQRETVPSPSVMDARWIRDAENSVSEGCEGGDGFTDHSALSSLQAPRRGPAEAHPQALQAYGTTGGEKPFTTVTSFTNRGFAVSPTVTDDPSTLHSPPPAPRSSTPITVDGQTGWRLPGAIPTGSAPTVRVLVTNPSGQSVLVERRRIQLATEVA